MSEGGDGGGGSEMAKILSGDVAPEDNPFQNPAVIACDWVAFISLLGASAFIFFKLTAFRGPQKNDYYFMGYREEKLLSVYVNLFAAIAYWARLASHANGDVGSAAIIHVFKYGDYMLTCPLLTLDLLWSLNLPFKLTGAVGVFVCIGCALGCQVMYGPARYMWFGFGMTLFTFTWANILYLTRQRLSQLVSKEAIKMRDSLSFALFFYFGIWLSFPTLWILKETKVISEVISLCLHMIVDVLSKSVYGFALLNFQIRSEELEFIYLPLRPRFKDMEEDEGMSVDEVTADIELGGPKLTFVGSKDARDLARSRAGSADYGMGPTPMRASLDPSEKEMADTVRQIQMLNAQLDQMVAPYDKRAV